MTISPNFRRAHPEPGFAHRSPADTPYFDFSQYPGVWSPGAFSPGAYASGAFAPGTFARPGDFSFPTT
jgi:hypothetical protein